MLGQQRPPAGGIDPPGRAGATISAMAVRLGIGDFSRMTHLSVKAQGTMGDLDQTYGALAPTWRAAGSAQTGRSASITW